MFDNFEPCALDPFMELFVRIESEALISHPSGTSELRQLQEIEAFEAAEGFGDFDPEYLRSQERERRRSAKRMRITLLVFGPIIAFLAGVCIYNAYHAGSRPRVVVHEASYKKHELVFVGEKCDNSVSREVCQQLPDNVDALEDDLQSRTSFISIYPWSETSEGVYVRYIGDCKPETQNCYFLQEWFYQAP